MRALPSLVVTQLVPPADALEDPPCVLGHPAVQVAVGIPVESPVVRVGGVTRDTGQLERLAVVPVGVTTAMRDVHRMVGHCLIQMRPVERAVRHLGVVEHEATDPVAGRRVSRLRAERSLDLGHGRQVDIDAIELVHAARMAVGIDEARRDRHPFGIDHLGARPDDVANVVAGSDSDEPAVLHREGLGLWHFVVNRVDTAVDERKIRLAWVVRARFLGFGGALPGARGTAGEQGAQPEELFTSVGGHRTSFAARRCRDCACRRERGLRLDLIERIVDVAHTGLYDVLRMLAGVGCTPKAPST